MHNTCLGMTNNVMIAERERESELDMIFFYILHRIIGYISGCALVDLKCLVGGWGARKSNRICVFL